jgi:hypothetical protein
MYFVGDSIMVDHVFEPETLTPWEQAQHTSQQALSLHKQIQQVGKGFDFERFVREFANPLLEAYNSKAKAQGLPLANRQWFQLLRSIKGKAVKPKDFYIKYRTTLQPRMFPGDLTKATKAYNVFLSELNNLPLAISGPVSGILAHEFGHGQTYLSDPSVPIAAQRPSGVKTGRKVERLINEAVASYKGFQTSWKAWERFGIPHKAWGAWYGFPTHLTDMTELQFVEAMKLLKGMEGKYPGISEQVRKVLQEYNKYVEPVMYNIPGQDWTAEEKIALQRFLKERGAPYRESVPDEQTRMRHLRRQPYVQAPTQQPTSVVAELLLPLSKRAQLPLSCRRS